MKRKRLDPIAPGEILREEFMRPLGFAAVARLAVFWLPLVLATGVAAGSPATLRVGDALDDGGRLVYQERHHYEFEDGARRRSVTTYHAPDGREFGRMEAEYPKDSPTAPRYRLVDARFETEQAARREGDRVVLSRKRDGRMETKEVRIDPGELVVIGPGFDLLVERHWQDLVAGRTVRCLFAIPGRLQLIRFRIERVDAKRLPPSRVRLRVELDSFLLNLLVDGLTLEYDAASGAIRSYSGVSNLPDAAGSQRSVEIRFPGTARLPLVSAGLGFPSR